MERIERTVFISYRRTNFPWAVALFQNLKQKGYNVFLDYSGIASGGFESVILENIRARAHFLLLLTPSALERCANPGDWLLREIETALDSRRNIVPLMLDGFDFETPTIASQLTGKLAELARYNALRVPPDYFDEAMERLCENFLNVPLEMVLHPASIPAQQYASEQKASFEGAPVVGQEELRGQQWFERGFNATDPDEKARSYSESIQLEPDFADAYYGRANARLDQDDTQGALDDYNEAIRLAPDHVEAFNNRGVVRRGMGDLEGAMRDFNEAIRIAPDHESAFFNRASARWAKGNREGALQDYDQAIRLASEYADAYNDRGALYEELGNPERAMEDYSEAIRWNHNHAQAFNNRGNLRNSDGDLDGAIRDYNEAIRADPHSAEAFHNRGVVRSAKGQVDLALKDYTEAIRLKPDFAEAFNGRANLYRAQGNMKRAFQDRNEAIRLGLK